MNLQDVVRFTAERIPRKLAISAGGLRLSYEDWAGQIYSLANSFATLGMTPGDRVVVIMGNTIAHATATVAAVVGGGVSVPFNVRAAPLTMAQVVNDSDPRVVVIDDAALKDQLLECGVDDERLAWVLSDPTEGNRKNGFQDLGDLIESGSSDSPSTRVGDNDVANILYTSGTTGIPKGIPHTHQQIYERMLWWALHFGPVMSGGVRSLGISPMYHIVGSHCVLWLTILENGSYHLPNGSDGHSLLRQIDEERISFIAASPVILERLAAAAEERQYDLSSVNTVVPGSAPRPPHLMERLQKILPYARFGEAYGTSEGVMFGGVDLFEKPGAFQVVGDEVVRVIKPGGLPDEIVDDDVEGELIVSVDSKRVVKGYWKRPKDTQDRYRHGWFYTGDAVRRDAEGDIWVLGRLDDMFISGGENIQPTEVEGVLQRHPSVRDCAVVGTPHTEWGEVCTAFVVQGDDATVEELDRFLRDAVDIADFKRPRRYVVVSEIERNPTGKIMRKEYRRRWIEGEFQSEAPAT